jgi:hypothetical protein
MTTPSNLRVPAPDALPNPPRRTALKAGLGTSPLLLGMGLPQPSMGGTPPPSPPTTPFLEPLPTMPVLPARPLTDPAFRAPPTEIPNRAINPRTGLPFEGRGMPTSTAA